MARKIHFTSRQPIPPRPNHPATRHADPSPPTTTSPRRERGARTRAAILAVAERIFAEVGLDGARTDLIASAAGVNKALLYYYFRSKDELFRAVLEEHLTESRRQVLAILGRQASVRSRLIAYVEFHFDRIASRPYYPRLVHRLMAEGSEVVEQLFREYSAPLYHKLVEIIEEGVRSGELRVVDPHHTVYSLVALNVFYFSAAPIIKAVSHVDALNPKNVKLRKQAVIDFVRYGLFRDPEAPFA